MLQEPLSAQEFYELIQTNNRKKLDLISRQLVEGVQLYLKVMFRAEPELAEDLAQQVFVHLFEKVKDNELEDLDNIYGYLIRSAKNQFLMHKRRMENQAIPLENQLSKISGPEDILNALYEEERKKILMDCIEKLDKEQRKFIFAILRLIDETEEKAAGKLKMSHTNFRTRKFRLIHILHECVSKFKSS